MFDVTFEIEFGDCDPAGIVFYPRFFGWFDATFQRWLRARGTSQAAIAARFGAVGTGLVDVGARFRAPLVPGDTITLSITGVDWDERTFAVRYQGRCDGGGGGRICVEGEETRGLFVRAPDGRLRLVPLAELRAMIEA